ncbi:hypothetical protein [Streptomyces sp. CB02261]|uniref:hypothetical protein n=1 Tax=Streptomyces sp. CB02261 TaxID=1703940 RepID=UPI00093EE1C6|nr:hypothetical protein [Streptomyces sp. CB02261]
MIKNMLRGLAALSLSLTPLIAPAPAQADEVLQLAAALDQVRVSDESRAGYTRDKFKQWNSGLDLGDGCNTRAESSWPKPSKRRPCWIPEYLDFDENRALAVKAIWALGAIPGTEAREALEDLRDDENEII